LKTLREGKSGVRTIRLNSEVDEEEGSVCRRVMYANIAAELVAVRRAERDQLVIGPETTALDDLGC